MNKYTIFLFSIVLSFTLCATAKKSEIHLMSIFGTQNVYPMPVLIVHCPNLQNQTVQVDVYQFTDGTGTELVSTLTANIVQDDSSSFQLQTQDEVKPVLSVKVDRNKSYSTAPFAYPAQISFQDQNFNFLSDRASTRELNPEYPQNNEMVGAMLRNVIKGELGLCSKN